MYEDTLESFPLKFRKEMLAFLGQFISRLLKEKGVTEEKILADFKTFKKTRHRPKRYCEKIRFKRHR